MTLDELKEFAQSDDGAAIMSSYLEDSGYISKDDVSGLEAKKNELLGKLKREKDEKQAILDVFKKHDIIDSDDLENKLGKLSKAEENLSDIEKLNRRIEVFEKQTNEAKAMAERERALRADSEKRSQILSALKEAHVNDDSFDVLVPYFDRLAKVQDEDGKINLVVESDDGQSPFNSFVEEWSKTEKAKAFIKAPANSGGGAGGPGGRSGGKMTLDDIEKMPNRDDRLKAMAELGAEIK